jgi:hypothetical protein
MRTTNKFIAGAGRPKAMNPCERHRTVFMLFIGGLNTVIGSLVLSFPLSGRTSGISGIM